jgi:rare lipoprotein A
MIDALARRRDAADTRIRLSIRFGGSVLVACSALMLANCTPQGRPGPETAIAPPVAAPETKLAEAETVEKTKSASSYRANGTDRPYVIAGKKYTPQKDPSGYKSEGLASWYGPRFHGRRTSNGEVFDANSISAAHRTLPLPSYARVTNTANGKSIIVRVNDRGPFHDNRVVDVSQRTAELLDFRNKGMAKVEVEYVGPAKEEGSDNQRLLATLTDKTRSIASSAATMLASLVPGGDKEPQAPQTTATPAANPVSTPEVSASVAVAQVPSPKPRAPASTEVAATAPQAAATEVAVAVPAQPTPQVKAATATRPAAPKPAPTQLADATPAGGSAPAETTGDAQIASRIASGFSGVSGSAANVLQPSDLGAPVLGSMAFSPSDLRGSR